MSADTIAEDPRWDIANLSALADRSVEAVLQHVGLVPQDWEVTVLGCDDARITALNGDFRAKPQATNVLSWPSEERGAETPGRKPRLPTGSGELGDIAIAYETCAAEAEKDGKTLENHASHLIVHGVLHLLGYDHVRDADADLMESTEIAILASLGVPNPYGDRPGAIL